MNSGGKMKEYIKRTDAMRVCEIYSKRCFRADDSAGQDIADEILDDVINIPTANVREVVYAHWDTSSESYRCTNCDRSLDEIMDADSYFSGRINIEKEIIACPFCGAIMDGGNSEKK